LKTKTKNIYADNQKQQKKHNKGKKTTHYVFKKITQTESNSLNALADTFYEFITSSAKT